ncbi:hypothetical protein L6472_06130 [Prevotella sp. E13-17]|uniref:hypothetical protein n=1 Tax=Prevotella sp. E13-17 TaxID=2913616 RepID=UPI001EDB16A4|nr:hypothetical protein [Prevotella sp. E13-17]UKK52156.1 hypothetical protein L6472_06130 [Prevotella sp. E13-17]
MMDCPIYDPAPLHPDPVVIEDSNMQPEGRNAGVNLPGTQMSVTQLRRAKLID